MGRLLPTDQKPLEAQGSQMMKWSARSRLTKCSADIGVCVKHLLGGQRPGHGGGGRSLGMLTEGSRLSESPLTESRGQIVVLTWGPVLISKVSVCGALRRHAGLVLWGAELLVQSLAWIDLVEYGTELVMLVGQVRRCYVFWIKENVVRHVGHRWRRGGGGKKGVE